MSNKQMWFGNQAHMQWVPCPQAGADYSAGGSAQSMGYLNGGAFRRQTLTAAKTYQLSWNLTSRESIRAITDYAEGVYGNGLIFWSDPFTMDQNVLTQSFATPSLGGYDGPTLDGSDERPELVATSANTLGYPTETAIYEMVSGEAGPRHWIPIPPKHTAWVGVHGTAGSGTAGIYITRTNGLNNTGSATLVPFTPVTSSTRVTTAVNATSTVNGIKIYLSGSGTCNLTAIIVQILPTGQTPKTGGFISGQGHSGCAWDGMPAKEAYSSALDLAGLSASFVETGIWQ